MIVIFFYTETEWKSVYSLFVHTPIFLPGNPCFDNSFLCKVSIPLGVETLYVKPKHNQRLTSLVLKEFLVRVLIGQ